MVVSMNPPHTGYELVPDRYKQLYANLDVEAICNGRPDIPAKGTPDGDYFRENIRNYYACMTGVDENIGRIVHELERKGLLENTIIVFASDHGVCMGTHHLTGKNVYYEEAMRIPFIVSWKGKLKPRRDDHTMIAFADIYPTVLSLMGFGKNIPPTVQSHNLGQLLRKGKENKNLWQPYYFVQVGDPSTGYRGIRNTEYTFVVHCTKGVIDETILFDRIADNREMTNFAQQRPAIVKSMKEKLIQWLMKTNDPFVEYLKLK